MPSVPHRWRTLGLFGALGVLRGGLLPPPDLARLAAEVARVSIGSGARLAQADDRPAAEALAARGFSPAAVDGFFRPFFSGVFLEDELVTSSRFLDLMLRMFVRGRSTVPARGMREIPRQIVADLPAQALHLATPAEAVTPTSVSTPAGSVTARAVVLATDAGSAAGLVDGLPPTRWRSVTTVYHAAPRDPIGEPTLVLDADPSPVLNTVVMTAAAPTYGPGDGRALVSTSVLGTSVDERVVRDRLATLYRTATDGWEHLATYQIGQALPAMPAPHPMARPVRVSGAYVCGDHRDTSSIQGALVSGRRAASAVLRDLGVQAPAVSA